MDFSHVDTNNEMVIKIITNAYEVFALNDYKKASTNMIVKKAGVSRGILYHYFKDKEDLFDFLNFYAIKISVKDIDKALNWNDDDLIRRICDITKYRLEVIRKYPYLIEFAEKYRDQIYRFIDAEYINNWRNKFYNDSIDHSKFKDESNMKEILHIVRWTYKGLYKDLKKDKIYSFDDDMFSNLINECDRYYKILSSSFYK